MWEFLNIWPVEVVCKSNYVYTIRNQGVKYTGTWLFMIDWYVCQLRKKTLAYLYHWRKFSLFIISTSQNIYDSVVHGRWIKHELLLWLRPTNFFIPYFTFFWAFLIIPIQYLDHTITTNSAHTLTYVSNIYWGISNQVCLHSSW